MKRRKNGLSQTIFIHSQIGTPHFSLNGAGEIIELTR